jgi:hypothetical protein
LASIDNAEIIDTVHGHRAPMGPGQRLADLLG